MGRSIHPAVTLRLGQCELKWEPEHRRAVVSFPDGSQAYGRPHLTVEYQALADGLSIDVDMYAWTHDVCHVLYGLQQPGGLSPVLYAAAHGQPTDGPVFDAEELAVQQMQRAFFMRP
jgi:hypothetical protein